MKRRSIMHWLVRRELWENRFIYIAPLVVAGLALVGFVFHMGKVTEATRLLTTLLPDKAAAMVSMPYSIAASIVLVVGWLVGVFYCLDALHGERRDRSILFWKSMPVSDLATVTSKAIIPLAVLPLVGIAVVLALQLTMLAVSSVAMMVGGVSPSLLWQHLPLGHMTVVMVYGVTIHVLWFAPIYAWFLLVSAWARRVVFLWAVLPFVALFILEKLSLGTTWFLSILRYRLMGAMAEAFSADAMKGPITKLSQLDPMKFLSTPGLWVGLLFAAACFIAAVRLRRSREPT